jgi:hypothetical protein
VVGTVRFLLGQVDEVGQSFQWVVHLMDNGACEAAGDRKLFAPAQGLFGHPKALAQLLGCGIVFWQRETHIYKDQEHTTTTSLPIDNSLPVLLRREEWPCGWLDREDSLYNVSPGLATQVGSFCRVTRF